MKAWKIAIALFCIFIAVFGLLETFGVTPPMASVVGKISVFRLICAAFLVALAIKYLFQLRICKFLFSLSFLFMTVESNIAYLCGAPSSNLINNWLLLFYTVLICIGLSLILPKRKKKQFRCSGDFDLNSDGIDVEFNESSHHENSLGSRTVYIDSATFTERSVENNLGSTVIRFENPDAYQGGGLLKVENNLGSIVIDVPAKWSLDCRFENNLGRVQNEHNEVHDGPVLTIFGENNLGSVVIRED